MIDYKQDMQTHSKLTCFTHKYEGLKTDNKLSGTIT